MKLRLATRRSPLALWQADEVARLLRRAHPGIEIESLPISTTADERLDLTIAELGGKGAFATQVQALVVAGEADAAVHSAKDLPSITVPDLVLAAVPRRGNPFDVLVGAKLNDLPSGATILTGSARRRVQLQHRRPDISFGELRGNIATRLGRIPDRGAIVMAAAALERLGVTSPTMQLLGLEAMVPQVGQGALAVECRADDAAVRELLAVIEHRPSRIRLEAERDFLVELGGDCDLPAGAFAELGPNSAVTVTAVLAGRSGTPLERRSITGAVSSHPGARIATDLRSVVPVDPKGER